MANLRDKKNHGNFNNNKTVEQNLGHNKMWRPTHLSNNIYFKQYWSTGIMIEGPGVAGAGLQSHELLSNFVGDPFVYNLQHTVYPKPE